MGRGFLCHRPPPLLQPSNSPPSISVDDITDFPKTLQQFPAFQSSAGRCRQRCTWAGSGHPERDSGPTSARQLEKLLIYHGSFSSFSLDRLPQCDGSMGPAQPSHSRRINTCTYVQAPPLWLCSRESTGAHVDGVGREGQLPSGNSRPRKPGSLGRCIFQSPPRKMPFSPYWPER